MSDQLWYGIYQGICSNNVDPEGLFKITAIVPQVFGNDTTETAWAWPCFDPGHTNHVPNPGDVVWIAFQGGELNHPLWLGVLA